MNQDDMLQFLHSIHNKIRNAKGLKLTGLAALNEINNFFALYFVKDKVVKKGLPIECSFDDIYNKYASDIAIKGDNKFAPSEQEKRLSYKLWKDIYSYNNQNCIMRQIINNEYFSPYFANDVTKVSAYATNCKPHETIQEIFNMFYKKFSGITFDYKLFDALGSAYEKFKTDEISNTGKHTGQHFTPVSIKKIIVNELKPTYKDRFYEPCAGSGGFIHTACNYVYEHDQGHLDKFKRRIYANEINPELQKPLMVNLLLHDVPVSKINVDSECDSLSMENCKRYMNKMDKCGTNVPFGVKTNLTAMNDYWNPLTSGKDIIKESTAQFIVHIYHCLKENGVAGVVVDRGVLNNGSDGKNSWQQKFRKWLLENTDLYKIVYMPTGIFDYTKFATAIIFFKKGVKTEKVEFYEAAFIDPKKKGDIEVSKKPIKVLTIDEIEKQNWSLKLELEEKEELKEGWVKLGDVIEINFGTRITKANDAINETSDSYPVYGGGDIVFHTKTYNRDGETLILSRFGVSPKCVRIITGKIFLNDSAMSIKTKENFNFNFAKYFMKMNELQVFKYASGSGQKNMETNRLLKEFQIPNLSKPHQQEIVDFLDKQFETYDINKLGDKLKDIKLFDLLIAKQYDMCADALHLIYRKMETDALIKAMDRDKKATFNMLLNCCDYEIVKLGDIVAINKENHNDETIKKIKNINYIDISSIENNVITTITELSSEIPSRARRILHINDILVSSVRPNLRKIASVNKDNMIGSTGFFVISCNKKIDHKYLLQFLITDEVTNYLEVKSGGNAYPSINRSTIDKTKIKLPSLKDQQKIIAEIEKIDAEQATYKQYGVSLQKLIDNLPKVISKMVKEKEPNNVIDISNDDSDNDTTQDLELELELESEPKPKSKSQITVSEKKPDSYDNIKPKRIKDPTLKKRA
jgi:type I restriction-modification system DNA methylase subunit